VDEYRRELGMDEDQRINLAEGRVVLKAGSFSGYRWSDSGAGSVSKKIALGRKGLPLINTVGTDL
jgi:hypothetical protein